MKLIIGDNTLLLKEGEFLWFHDGRDGFKFNLDCSICDVADLDRAQELRLSLEKLHSFTSFTMEPIQILHPVKDIPLFEVLFSISDFCPIIKEVI
jgi:hypothetical protein